MGHRLWPKRSCQFGRQTGACKALYRKPCRALPPVEQWNPPFAVTSTCGSPAMDLFYCGTPITRPALVRLFSTILRKDPDGYVLVTPVEKVGIKVEDAAFLAVEMTVARPQPELVLRFRPMLGIGLRRARTSHAIRKSRFRWTKTLYPCARRSVGARHPYRVSRSGRTRRNREHEGSRCFGVTSAVFFSRWPVPKRRTRSRLQIKGNS